METHMEYDLEVESIRHVGKKAIIMSISLKIESDEIASATVIFRYADEKLNLIWDNNVCLTKEEEEEIKKKCILRAWAEKF